MKKKIALLTTAMLITGGFLAYSREYKSARSASGITLIPSDAIYILETQNPIENWKTFSQSTFWSFLKTHPSLAEITKDADYLDKTIHDNRRLLGLFGKRDFYLSAHLTKKNDYDFLFLTDIGRLGWFDIIPLALKATTSKKTHSISEDEYKGVIVVDLYNKDTKEHIYFAQLENFVAISYTDHIVLNAIDASEQKAALLPPTFQMAYDQTTQAGLARLYLNYSFIDEFISLYAQLSPSILETVSQSFAHTGLDVHLAEHDAKMEGFTSIPTSSSYNKLLQEYGNASFGFEKVLSKRIAYLQAIGINNFKDFFEKVTALRMTESETAAEYLGIKNRVEKILGISLEKDLLAWMGNEIVLAQSNPSKLHHNEDDMLMAIKANQIDFATEKLFHIQAQIRKRTPAKFKKLTYKSHDIYYLDIKGFFGMFFGNAFSKITKPYYTIIGDYIVFSNEINTLVSAIEDYKNGEVLASSEDFMRVKSNVPSKSALFSYVNGPHAYSVFKSKIPPADLASYLDNQPYIDFFKGIGITYTAQGTGFANHIYFHFEETPATILPKHITNALTKITLGEHDNLVENLTDPELFMLNEVNNGILKKYYSNGKILHVWAATKKGKLHGTFLEYYINGKAYSKGKYRKGRKVGRWIYFSRTGELVEKKWEGF